MVCNELISSRFLTDVSAYESDAIILQLCIGRIGNEEAMAVPGYRNGSDDAKHGKASVLALIMAAASMPPQMSGRAGRVIVDFWRGSARARGSIG
jgi:hypothetical protein